MNLKLLLKFIGVNSFIHYARFDTINFTDEKDSGEKQDQPKKPQNSHLPNLMKEQEKESIIAALNTYFGSRDMTAKSLGISRVSLWRKMKKYGLSGWKFQQDSSE